MKKNLKRRLAVWLCLFLVLQAVSTILPTRELFTEEVNAKVTYNMYFTGFSEEISVEEGQSVVLGNYVRIWENDTKKNAGGKAYCLSGVKGNYETSDATIASIDDKGVLETLSVGDTEVTVGYKSEKRTITVHVVEKDSFADIRNSEGMAEYSELINKLIAAVPANQKMTTKNAYSLINLYNKAEQMSHNLSFYSDGVMYDYDESVYKLVFPEAGIMDVASLMQGQFSETYHPFSTTASKALKLKSATGKAGSSSITLKFKSKVTEANILCLQMYGEDSINRKKAEYPYLYVWDQDGNCYDGKVVLNANKNTATLKLSRFDYDTNEYVPAKLKKGTTYYIGASKVDWGGKKKVTIK